MRAKTTPFDIFRGHHGWKRIGLGWPVFLASLLALSLLGWLFSGLSAKFAPDHWLHEPTMAVFLAMIGTLCGLFVACILYVVSLFAFVIGDVLLDKIGERSRRGADGKASR